MKKIKNTIILTLIYLLFVIATVIATAIDWLLFIPIKICNGKHFDNTRVLVISFTDYIMDKLDDAE